MGINTPKTLNEFLTLMEEIDDDLKKKNIPIYDRPIHASIAISKRLKINLPLVPVNEDVQPSDFSENGLSYHIHDWYKQRYGDRLKAFMGVGHGVILIKNDPWKIIFPKIFGTVYLSFDADLDKYEKQPPISNDGKPPIINIFHLIEDFPKNLAITLNKKDVEEIKQIFLSGLEAISCLDSIKLPLLIKEAKADLKMAVDNLLSQPPQFGLSKWSSLQFSEKLLKSYLQFKKKTFPYSHDLSKLAEQAENNGLPQLSSHLIEQVQCPAGVRYGDPDVTLKEAVKAHYASLGICFFVSKSIADTKNLYK